MAASNTTMGMVNGSKAPGYGAIEEERSPVRTQLGGAPATEPRRPLRLLMVEDVDSDAELLLRELRRGGFDLRYERVQAGGAMAEALTRGPWDIVVSDFSMPEFDAPRALAVLKESGLDLPFIVLSGTITEENAVESLRAGAHDFISKGKLARLLPAIDRELREAKVREANRELEERLRQSQKLEAIGSLAGGIAHDFNNLLAIISSYTELLAQGITDDAMREDLHEVQSAARRAVALTKQLMAFSRRQVLNPIEVDPNDLVLQMEKMLARVIGKGIVLGSRLGTNIGRVKVDPGQFDQVVLNLVVNARDATPSGGRVTIETANAVLSERLDGLPVPPGRYVTLSVTDTGSGMDARTQSRLFEPFFTTKEPGKGTGLGLATVHGIVKQSGGHISVKSELGRGTTFVVYLPAVGDVE